MVLDWNDMLLRPKKPPFENAKIDATIRKKNGIEGDIVRRKVAGLSKDVASVSL